MSKIAETGGNRIAAALRDLSTAEIVQTRNLAEHLTSSRKEGEPSPSAVVMGKARAEFLHELSKNNFPKENVGLTDLGNGLYAVTVGEHDFGVILSKS